MKIQLDYDKKVITLDNNVNLGDLSEKIQKILPDWKDWTLNTQTVINNWSSPIIIDRYVQPYRPWWEYGPLYCTSASDKLSGTYSLELN